MRHRTAALVLWPLAPALLWLSWYRPFAASQDVAAALPSVAGRFVESTRLTLTAREHELLGTDDATWREYRAGGPPVYVVAVFHRDNWKSIHPPHLCLRGSDMELVADDETAVEVDGERIPIGRIVAAPRGDPRPYVSLYAYGARDLVTGSYGEFFWHHAPHALFRLDTRGFLLRVETFVEPGEDRTAAERRCAELLAALLAPARALLR